MLDTFGVSLVKSVMSHGIENENKIDFFSAGLCKHTLRRVTIPGCCVDGSICDC